MNDLNELLQMSLSALENGTPLERVLAELPPEAQELAPMLRLAAATRRLPYPKMHPESVRTQRLRISEAKPLPRHRLPSLPFWLTGNKSIFVLGSAVVLLVAVVLAVSFFSAGPVSARSASLVNPQGMVEVASSETGDDWHFIDSTETITQGQRLRTYSDSSVALVYYDGSRTSIGANSELTLTTLNGAWRNVLQVQFTQEAGTTTNDVVPLSGTGFFLVNTLAGEASVHGTSFDVNVNPEGTTLFAVTHGKVEVKNPLSQVTLASGQATAALPGKSLEQPGYQFTLQGPVTSIVGDQWIVDNIAFVVTAQTDILGTYDVGDAVLVKGRILTPGNWVADSIDPAKNTNQTVSFTGVIEAMPAVPGIWLIGGMEIGVNEQTKLAGGLNVGTPVKVNAVVLPNGDKMLATKIVPLEDEEKPTPTATRTVTITGTAATPTSTVTPTTTVTPSSTPTLTVTVTGTLTTGTPTPTMTTTSTVVPKNDNSRCDNRTQQQPEALRLAQRYHVTYDEIISWFCKGFGFGEIDLAYGLSLSSGMPVSNIFSMRSSGLGWDEIKKQLSATGTPYAPGNGKGKGPTK
jgi:hypothetical protein